MKAERILQFGPPDVIVNDEVPQPEAGEGQLLVRVKAAGVGPWDALIREGKSEVSQSLPLTLGSDLAGVVEAIGPGVSGFKIGDEVFGTTNQQFTGAYAEYALASAKMIAAKPASLNFLEAASAPVVAVTAMQMLFDYAHLVSGQSVLILGGAGNVGAYAVQLARNARLQVTATASTSDLENVKALGANQVIERNARFENIAGGFDAVIDTVGGETRERSYQLIKPDGILVSVASPVSEETAKSHGVRAVFFLVEVTTARLQKIAALFDSGRLVAHVGSVLPLQEARTAHLMLAGAPHKPGKIVLTTAA